MIATAKGFFDGQQIVLDPPGRLEAGQEVVIAYTVVTSKTSKESKSNIVDSLIGAIPNAGKSLEDYRSERLEKYADNG